MPDFDLKALYDALDAKRDAEGLSWAGVARQVNDPFRAVELARPLAVSTIRGLATKHIAEGDGVLGMLLWLEMAPERFVPDHPLASADEARLPRPPQGHVLRWDAPGLHAALDERREGEGMAWVELAAELGCAPSQLTGLSTAQRVHFPLVMRHTTWLARPAASFTRFSEW